MKRPPLDSLHSQATVLPLHLSGFPLISLEYVAAISLLGPPDERPQQRRFKLLSPPTPDGQARECWWEPARGRPVRRRSQHSSPPFLIQAHRRRQRFKDLSSAAGGGCGRQHPARPSSPGIVFRWQHVLHPPFPLAFRGWPQPEAASGQRQLSRSHARAGKCLLYVVLCVFCQANMDNFRITPSSISRRGGRLSLADRRVEHRS